MDRELLRQALTKFFAGLVLTALLVFLPAGTLRYPGGLLLMAVLFVPMFAAGLVMLFKSPELLRKRLSANETQPEQRRVVAASGAMFVTAFLLAGLGRRFRWPALPGAVSWAATGVFLLGYVLYAEVLRENVWLSRTVEVQANQKVVDTGLYGVVRHPMYLSTLLIFLAMPLILGSVPAFIVTLAYIPIIRRRIVSEEAVLVAGLTGYPEYMKKVRYRLIPCIW